MAPLFFRFLDLFVQFDAPNLASCDLEGIAKVCEETALGVFVNRKRRHKTILEERVAYTELCGFFKFVFGSTDSVLTFFKADYDP